MKNEIEELKRMIDMLLKRVSYLETFQYTLLKQMGVESLRFLTKEEHARFWNAYYEDCKTNGTLDLDEVLKISYNESEEFSKNIKEGLIESIRLLRR